MTKLIKPREENYPATFAYKVIDFICNSLEPNKTLTICGFGKSIYLRYLAYNKNYKERKQELLQQDFLYLDLKALHSSSLIDLMHFLLVELLRFKGTNFVTKNILAINNLQQLQLELEELLTDLNCEKLYIIWDHSDVLFKDHEDSIVLLKHLRTKYNSKIEYILQLKILT